MVIAKSALAAANTKMRPAQGFGHAAGGDAIDLHYKDNKNQCAGECCDQPFGIMVNAVYFSVAAD